MPLMKSLVCGLSMLVVGEATPAAPQQWEDIIRHLATASFEAGWKCAHEGFSFETCREVNRAVIDRALKD